MTTLEADSSKVVISRAEVEGLIAECEAVEAALARGRTTRLLLLFGFLALLAVIGWLLWRIYQRVNSPEYLGEIQSVVQQRLETRSGDYLKEMESLVRSTSPTIVQAFYKQAKGDLPQYLSQVETERDILVKNLTSNFEGKMEEHIQSVLAEHQAILRSEFPEFEDPEVQERLTRHMAVVLENMAKKYYVDELENEFLTLYKRWDDFPPAQRPAAHEHSLEDQFTGQLLNLLKLKMVEAENLEQASR